MERKKHIRKELLIKRNSLTNAECEKYSSLITEKLLSHSFFGEADSLLIYASYQKEVFTGEIMEKALKQGKKVYCPKVLEAGRMEFYEICSMKDVDCGYKNIPEPVNTDCLFERKDGTCALMIMPLVGFDDRGNRLGYGGGFYDRYLQDISIKRIALAYECQKSEVEIPVEETDIKPEFIITECNIYKVDCN